jgi:dTDP-4-dehydrorhamnose 3,5-epimerase-like enzyme
MTEPRLIWLETHREERGILTTITPGEGTIVPFDVKRVFYVYGVPLQEVRGGHAHKTCHQLLVAVGGMVLVKMGNGKEHLLNDPQYGLYIPPGNTTRMIFLTKTACLLVLASEPYDPDDYVYDTGERK